MKKKLLAFSLIMLTMFSILTGCGTKNSQSESPSTTPSATITPTKAPSDTIVVTDARGEVEIPSNPQRIVDLGGYSDTLSILGYSVVGTCNSDAYDYTKFPTYLEETLKDATILGYSMQDTIDVESILALDPDLIIISSVQEKMYTQLQEIAPTVMIELAQIDWKEDLTTLATIFKKEDVAKEWLDNYESKAAAAGEEIKAQYGEDTTYLTLLASGGQLFCMDSAGVGMVLYEDMGLTKPENMPQQEDISLPVISYEGLAELDADYLVLITTEEDMKTLQGNAIYNAMTAVVNDHVIMLPSSPYFVQGYSCIGKELFVNEFATLMAASQTQNEE